MPKLLKKTLLLIIITAIFLAPISAGVKINDKGNLAVNVEKNEALAMSVTDYFGTSNIQVESTTSNSVNISGTIKITSGQQTKTNNKTTYDAYDYIGASGGETGVYLIITDVAGKNIMEKTFSELGLVINKAVTTNTFKWNSGTDKITLQPKTSYNIQLKIIANESWRVFDRYDLWASPLIPFETKDASVTGNNTSSSTSSGYGFDQDLSLGCTNLTSFSVSSCVAQLSYVVWSVSALVARAAGTFLDFLIYYSTNDTSYRNEFINQGWGAVRDIANIFFIIALLYVAIKTILGLNVTDNKKLIGAVIIIGLIINFSLFTTKLVIDSSNILAKVFYNNISSKESVAKNADGTPKDAVGGGGEKAVSVGLVQKFNPQNLVTQPQYDASPWTYIFMTILLTLLMLYMSYIFFSIGLLFVARVVSLWIAMIFAPIAFASYTVPFEIPGFGHKEWWKNLFENAILAPLFIFFLYIIILFAGFLTSIMNGAYGVDSTNLSSAENLMQHIMATLIPFVILFVLLGQAKKLAVKYSGDMGKAIQSIGGAVGGLALGGAALGLAAAGRGTVGAVVKNVQNDTARKNALSFKDTRDKWNSMNKLNPLSYLGLAGKAVAGTGKAATALAAQGIYSIPGTKGRTIGQHMQAGDEASGKKQTSQKTLDSVAKSEFGGKFGYEEDVKFKDLKENQQIEVRKAIDRDQIAKDYYKASDWKSIKEDADRKLVSQNVDTAYNNYKTTAQTNPAQAEADLKQQLNFAGLRNKDSSGDMLKFSKANVGLGQFVQALRKGTYDVRNLPNVGIGAKGITKLGLGITAAVATGMRAGLKSSLNVNAGTPQKNIMKDIGNTITEALKSVSFDVKLGGDGGGGHGGGGGHAKPAAGGHGKPATGGHGAHH